MRLKTKRKKSELPSKVLVLGSGALKIGEAGEFDYSGSQAIKALKEEGVRTVLINPNIATVQTSKGMADQVYFLPVTPYFVEKVIEKEKPDGLLLSFGGQTALNCGVALHEKGILNKHRISVLGTPVKAIIETEDRDLFVKKLAEVGIKTPRSIAVNSVKDALKAAEKIGYPIMARVAYALGGRGSGIATTESQLKRMAEQAFTHTSQILIEEWLGGWKEIEYEVVRDRYDNCITVCNMENFDPMGIHTGESIVVAPSQTLTNSEFHKLREISIRLIRHVGIVGECNVQFALDPNSEDYRVIEVNARLSRSSALASKATGYPLAFIAAKLALGYSLIEIENSITKMTKACFEPALDYVVVKIPRWDLKKFKQVSKELGSEMKSVGEIMAIGRKFEEALQKGIRMLQIGMFGLVCNKFSVVDPEDKLRRPTDKRLFVIADALKKGMGVDAIHKLTGIDPWFLYKIQNIIDVETRLRRETTTACLIREAKQLGFSDMQIGMLLGKSEMTVRALRKRLGIIPAVKQIDTLGAEYPAQTNYLYLTYNGDKDDVGPMPGKPVIVLGSGAYRIGSSVEFDWCCVSCVSTLRKAGHPTIMLNYNPETVSTDYDMCDRLYFDELSFERVLDVYEREHTAGIIISMGGQIPNNLAMRLHNAEAIILGTSPLSIDNAEDRNKFSCLLDTLGVDQPEWKELKSVSAARAFAKEVGYPVLVRPSYVLSGAAMNVAFTDEDLDLFLKEAKEVSEEYPAVVSKFIENAREVEIDAVARDGSLIIWAVTEHVENAGVHSGDATMVLPPQKTYIETTRQIKRITREIAKALKITGPFNIQFIAKDNNVKVIECNLRASRSFPFISQVSQINFIEKATKVIMGENVQQNTKSLLEMDYVGVKAPQFSFSRLKGADPTLSVEMTSTGEVACIGHDLHEAFLKALYATGFEIKKKTALITISGDAARYRFLESAKKLEQMGFELYATEHTFLFYKEHGIKCRMLYKVQQKKQPNVLDYITSQKIGLVINIPRTGAQYLADEKYVLRRTAVDFSVPLITNMQLANLFVESIHTKDIFELEIRPRSEYSFE